LPQAQLCKKVLPQCDHMFLRILQCMCSRHNRAPQWSSQLQYRALNLIGVGWLWWITSTCSLNDSKCLEWSIDKGSGQNQQTASTDMARTMCMLVILLCPGHYSLIGIASLIYTLLQVLLHWSILNHLYVLLMSLDHWEEDRL